MAMNKEFTDLVQEYLADGIISAKERAVLLKKAEKLGIDVDEADLYIDVQQQKMDQKIDKVASRKRNKRCPFCGDFVPMLTSKCPHCGKTITPQASDDLNDLLNNLEKALVLFKAEGKKASEGEALVDRYIRKANLNYGKNPIVRAILSDISSEKESKKIKLEQKEYRKKKYEEKQDRFVKLLGILWALSFLFLLVRCAC